MATDSNDNTSITLSIVTPAGMVDEVDVEMVTLPGVEGEFGVLPGHTPVMTRIRPGIIRFEEGGMPRGFCVTDGFVEVTENAVVVLSRTCEAKDKIDLDRARTAKDNAEKALEELAPEDEKREDVEAELERANTRIDFVEGRLDYYN